MDYTKIIQSQWGQANFLNNSTLFFNGTAKLDTVYAPYSNSSGFSRLFMVVPEFAMYVKGNLNYSSISS